MQDQSVVFRQARPQKKILITFNAIACLLLLVFAVVIFQQAKRTGTYGDWVVHTYEVLRGAHRIENNLFEIESAYRGYFLTGAREFLSSLERVESALDRDFRELGKMTADSPQQTQNVAALKTLYDDFITLQETQRRAYLRDGARALSVADIRHARQMMDRLQDRMATFTDIERDNLEKRLARSKAEHAAHMSTINTGAVLGIVGLIVANFIIILLLSKGALTARRLEDVEEMFQMTQEHLNDGYFEYDPQRNRIRFSSSYREQLGFADTDLPDDVEQGFNRLIHPDDRQRVWDQISLYADREIPEYSLSYRMLHTDGSWLWMLSRAVGVWDDEGICTRLIVVHTDINKQKKQEEALREVNNELESFTYIASHDLRSPLVNMKGFAQEIANSLDEAKQSYEHVLGQVPEFESRNFRRIFEKDIPESLGFIQSAVEKMDLLTGAILNLSRIGRRVYRPEQVNMNDLLRRVVGNLNHDITGRKAMVSVQENLPEVHADPLAIDQIFSNVIDNAVKYLSPDRPGDIAVGARDTYNESIFFIRDNGRGILPDDSGRVFDIFRRARNAADVRGVGMGLAFVRTAVRKMGGRIWYESQPDQGTTFFIAIPKKQQGNDNG